MSVIEAIQEHGQAEEQGPQAAEHASEAAAEGLASTEEIGSFISHHLEDSRIFEFAGLHFDLNAFAVDPIHIGSVTIDLSPTRQLIFILLSALLCIGLFVPMARAMTRREPSRAPSGFWNGMEAMVLYFRNEVARPMIGHGADVYTPFILTLFFFILFMNLFGLTPFGVTATGNLSVTAALAFVSLVVVEVSGMRALGPAGYARTIFYLPEGLPASMKPSMLAIMSVVEAIGKLAKPFALAIRLFANMMAGHILILSLVGLILVFESFVVGIGAVVVMSALMILELFIAFLQAYIFAMLTAVFIGLIRHAH